MHSRRFSRFIVLAVATASIATPAQATPPLHTAFKKVLQDRYDLRSVACTTCHVPEAPRTERNDLGLIFFDRLKDLELSRQFHESRRQGFDARRKCDEMLAHEFLEVLRSIELLPSSDGRTYADRFRRGDFDGLRVR